MGRCSPVLDLAAAAETVELFAVDDGFLPLRPEPLHRLDALSSNVWNLAHCNGRNPVRRDGMRVDESCDWRAGRKARTG